MASHTARALLAAMAFAGAGAGACTLSGEGTGSNPPSGSGGSGGSGGTGGDTGTGGSPSAGPGGAGGEAPTCDASWSMRLATTTPEASASTVAVDSEGHVIVATGFTGTTDLGGGTLTAGAQDVLIAKRDQAGMHQWSLGFGSADPSKNERANDVAVAPGNSLLVTGLFDTDIAFGGAPLVLPSGTNTFLAKLDAAGGHVWSQGIHNAEAGAVAADATGGAVVAGAATGPIDLVDPPIPVAGPTDAFVARYGAMGEFAWVRVFGDNPAQEASDVVVDSTGEVLVTGRFEGKMLLDASTELTSQDKNDAFLLKLDDQGNRRWHVHLSGDGEQIGRAVALAPFNAVVVAGEFQQDIKIDDDTTLSAEGEDMFLAKFDSNGAKIWAKRLVTNEHRVGRMAVDPDGRIFLTGYFKGTLDLDGTVLTSNVKRNVFFAVFDTNGVLVSSDVFANGDQDHYGFGIAVDACSNVVLTGTYKGALDFGADTTPLNAADYETFLLKIRPDPPL